MTWSQTHRRMAALAEAEAALAADPDRVPWRPDYEELFGTQEDLLDALRYRWRLRLQAHLDPDLDPALLDEAIARIRRDMPRLIAADLLPEVPATPEELMETALSPGSQTRLRSWQGGDMSGTTQTIDLWSSASFRQGHPAGQYRWLRDNAPVYWHEEPDGPGFWAVTRYDLVRQASTDHGTYSNRLGMTMGDLSPRSLPFFQQMMMLMDAPEHTAHRALVSRQFNPRHAAKWTDMVEAEAAAIIDSVRPRGECDLVADVAGKLPSHVIARLLGIPLEDGVRLYRLTETMHAAPDEVPESRRREAISDLLGYCGQVYAAKLAEPGDDLASRLVAAEIGGERLGPQRYGLFILLLLNAGGDTVRNLLGGGVLTLLSRPADLARLRADPGTLLPGVVEELLRYQSPVIYMRRTAARDTVLGGQPIAEGDKVLLYYGAANRDDRVFSDPEEFVLDRAENPHVAFGGHGPHYCLGAHLARIEITAMLRQVVTRLEGLALAGEPEWSPSNFISGPGRMPVTFRPTSRLQGFQLRHVPVTFAVTEHFVWPTGLDTWPQHQWGLCPAALVADGLASVFSGNRRPSAPGLVDCGRTARPSLTCDNLP